MMNVFFFFFFVWFCFVFFPLVCCYSRADVSSKPTICDTHISLFLYVLVYLFLLLFVCCWPISWCSPPGGSDDPVHGPVRLELDSSGTAVSTMTAARFCNAVAVLVYYEEFWAALAAAFRSVSVLNVQSARAVLDELRSELNPPRGPVSRRGQHKHRHAEATGSGDGGSAATGKRAAGQGAAPAPPFPPDAHLAACIEIARVSYCGGGGSISVEGLFNAMANHPRAREIIDADHPAELLPLPLEVDPAEIAHTYSTTSARRLAAGRKKGGKVNH
jgi:hypothetical protein